MNERAAVVIGVDQTGGGLPKLHSAAQGAHEVSSWLQQNGFDVTEVSDRNGQRVTVDRIATAIQRYVTSPPKYSFFLVYFSGHGQDYARSDVWLLSGAPTQPNEAINLDETIDLARYSGIENIVFISDACRSLPDAQPLAWLRGSYAFPNLDAPSISKIDYFKAASKGQRAYEAKIDGKMQSLLTYALRCAFTNPRKNMVKTITHGSKTAQVVPNRHLEEYLKDKVDEALLNIDPILGQHLDISVPSSDDTYIAPIDSDATIAPKRSPLALGGGRALTISLIGDDAATALERTLSIDAVDAVSDCLYRSMDVSIPETEQAINEQLPTDIADHYESEAGFAIFGAKIVRAMSTRGANEVHTELLQPSDQSCEVSLLRVSNSYPGTSVAIELDDGRCSVLACLCGYIGHARFAEDGLGNVTYIPSAKSNRWTDYVKKREKIDRLRALVAVATKHNTFKVHSPKEARELAERIRTEKRIDPTLGLYASHVFSHAGEESHITQILEFMRDDIKADLFDVRTLASRHSLSGLQTYPRIPFCPMLSQTWNLLRPRKIEVPAVLDRASTYLCNSLWTTFEADATPMIFDAITAGEVR